MDAPTRLCAACEARKTIRGIWYLVPLPGGDAPAFFCETCYSTERRRGAHGSRMTMEHRGSSTTT